jgi:hypothetical protein
MMAMLYFASLYLKDKGYTKMVVGNSRTFLKDGVLRLKKKWSQRIIGSAPTGFAFKVLCNTAATRAFLENNPFIFEEDGLLNGAVFVDGDDPPSSEEIRQINKNYFHPGLSKLIIYCFKPIDLAIEDLVPSELSENITLRPVDDVLKPKRFSRELDGKISPDRISAMKKDDTNC